MADSKTRFALVAQSKEEEDAYDYKGARQIERPVSPFLSFCHLVKGALGSGILGCHYAYMKAGFLMGTIGTILLGLYLTYSLYLIVRNAQILCRRSKIPSMSYPESVEAALIQTGRPKLIKYAYVFRAILVNSICFHLFGACITYQITMAKSIKQIIENTDKLSPEPLRPGYPGIRIYILIVLIPCLLISLIRHLAVLGKFSAFGIVIVLLCILTTIYYAFRFNPSFKNLRPLGNLAGVFEMIGMVSFGMSCVGAVLPIENHMKDPEKFKCTHYISFTVIVGFVVATGLCGYVAFREKSESPITLNFPMEIFPIMLRYLLILMIYTTHGVNFWIPFSVIFVYILKLHKNPSNLVRLELIYRAVIVVALNMIAFIFPSVEAIMGFLGTFCVALEAFTYPHFMEILMNGVRPGYGRFKWRLWKSLTFVCIGLFLFLVGNYFSLLKMKNVIFSKKH